MISSPNKSIRNVIFTLILSKQQKKTTNFLDAQNWENWHFENFVECQSNHEWNDFHIINESNSSDVCISELIICRVKLLITLLLCLPQNYIFWGFSGIFFLFVPNFHESVNVLVLLVIIFFLDQLSFSIRPNFQNIFDVLSCLKNVYLWSFFENRVFKRDGTYHEVNLTIKMLLSLAFKPFELFRLMKTSWKTLQENLFRKFWKFYKTTLNVNKGEALNALIARWGQIESFLWYSNWRNNQKEGKNNFLKFHSPTCYLRYKGYV